jgi:hypothetical protein
MAAALVQSCELQRSAAVTLQETLREILETGGLGWSLAKLVAASCLHIVPEDLCGSLAHTLPSPFLPPPPPLSQTLTEQLHSHLI